MSHFFLFCVLYSMNTDIFLQRVTLIRPNLERLALKKLGVQEDAEDLVQEVLMRLWLIREKWETHQNYKPLALHIFKHCIVNRYRKIQETELIEDQPLETYIMTPHQYIENKDLGQFIWKLIEQLPPLQQMIMRLKDIEGHEVEEIAQIANITPEAVRQNLSRARKKVRDEMIR